MSFVDRVVKSRDHLLRLVTGKSGGHDAWWYVRVKNNLFEQYKIAVKGEVIDLSEFGEILFTGWGKEPPSDIKKKIEEEY